MRREDRAVFSEAARHFNYWILVRRTNPDSLRYVGEPGYYPKPIDCKAKTADFDVGEYRLAGLVADPTLHPRAFSPAKLPKAQKIWEEFEQFLGGPLFAYKQGEPGQPTRRGYNLDENPRSRHFGCLTLQRLYLHGDYDLYDIIDSRDPQTNTATAEVLFRTKHMRSPLFDRVQEYINARLKVPMVQHGGEMQYTDHSEQTIDGFMPTGDFFQTETLAGIRGIYDLVFEGRQPLKAK